MRSWVVLPVAAAVLLTATPALAKSPRKTVTKLVDRIRRADYEGHREELRRLYDALAKYETDPELGVLVRYWRGFALWRRAFNGFNETPFPPDLEEDLELAVAEFDEAISKNPTFVDAKVGAGSCLQNLMFLVRSDQPRARELLARATPLLKEAEEAEPDNPRLLWVLGASRWYAPPEYGGGQDKAFDTYRKGLASARARKGIVKDALAPSWGEPELLMNLGWANLNATTPDLAAAEDNARAALALVPYWHYVRDILLPQILEAKAKK